MELISASRIQKAQQRMSEAGPYARSVTHAVSAVATYSDIDHPLLTEIGQSQAGLPGWSSPMIAVWQGAF
jgi:F0F1-type ATP synthase, gamma subunit